MLGQAGKLSARAARSAAKAVLADAALDGLPLAPVTKHKAAGLTFREYAEIFWKHYAPRWKPLTQRGNRSYIDKRLIPAFGDFRVKDIRRSDVLQWRDTLTRLTGAFNRAIPILAVMLNYAETLGLRSEGTNPCRGIPRFRRKAKERYLSARRYQRLAVTLRQWETVLPQTTAAVWLLLYTGARKREITTLCWEWIGSRFIDLPDSKTGPKRVYLNRGANEVLDRLERCAAGPVFGAEIAVCRLDDNWRKIRAMADLQDVRLHDLRHSFASVAIGNGISLTRLGRLLGHELPETTARYAHLADDLVHEAAVRVSDSIARALGVTI